MFTMIAVTYAIGKKTPAGCESFSLRIILHAVLRKCISVYNDNNN